MSKRNPQHAQPSNGRTRRLWLQIGCMCWVVASVGCGDGVGLPIQAATTKATVSRADAGSDKAGSGGGRASSFDAGSAARTDAGTLVSLDVPNTEYCAPVAQWPKEMASAEDALFEWMNGVRGMSAPNCGSRGGGPCALRPLVMSPALRCSARRHSKEMAERMFFAKTNPDGVDPHSRMVLAGLMPRAWGECIVQNGSNSTSARNQLLMGSDPDASANFNNWRFNIVGIGRSDNLWTIDFAMAP